jgi:hypothetical protein
MSYTPLHSAVGMSIVRIIPIPWVSLPVAFISHFILDLIPEAPFQQQYKIESKMIPFVQMMLMGFVFGYLVVNLSVITVLGFICANLPDMIDAVFTMRRKREFFCCHPTGWFPFNPDIWKMTAVNAYSTIFVDILLVWLLLMK